MRARNELARHRTTLEEQILRTADPAATQAADWLFDDLATWDFSRCRTGSYREINRRLEQTHLALHGRVKFEIIARYALADLLLIAAPIGLLSFREIPPNWGLVEFSEQDAGTSGQMSAPVRMRFADGPSRASQPRFRSRLLRNIAVAATQAASSTAIDRSVSFNAEPGAEQARVFRT